ncbi:hypothetical protein ACWD5R_39530 [Streptomyces sp. NPDC002514]|uniref:hypothetical protein n=1 Tax=Streptomyces sp. NPDC001270 TaxID=3364554 RepID=UPI00369B5D59
MSTTRRRLGTGPTTSRTTPTTELSLRLLPAERAEPDALLDEAERRGLGGRKGRRTLGPGGGGPLESRSG